MTIGAARTRPIAIVAGLVLLAAVPVALSVRHGETVPGPVDRGSTIRIVDARTGRPIVDDRQAFLPDPAPPTAPVPVDRRAASLVHRLAAHGGGDLPMLAEMVATQPRGTDDDAAEARAARLLAGHLRLAPGHPLHVRCVAALCQVSGTITSPATAIEAPALLESVLATGWTPGPVASAPVGNGSTDFLLFLNRES